MRSAIWESTCGASDPPARADRIARALSSEVNLGVSDSANASTREPPTPASAERYVFLDGLRGLAAMAIVVHHLTADSGHRELFASASIAVDFFFCLSGFVICHAYERRLLSGMTLLEYAVKRIVRLYPMYFVGTVVGLFAVLLMKSQEQTSLGSDAIVKAFTLNLAFLPYLNADYVQVFEAKLVGTIFPFNNPAWSLFFGLFANLMFASSVRLARHAAIIWLSIAAATLFLATLAYGEAPGWDTSNFTGGFPRVVYSFFAGVVICQFHHRRHLFQAILPAFVVAAALALFAMPRFEGHNLYWLAGALCIAPALVAAGSHCVMPRGSFREKFCSYAGRMSYPVFCIHYPLLALASGLLGSQHISIYLLLPGFVFLTLAVSHILLVYVEGRSQAWLASLVGVVAR
jgi:peptidoglycan/LPS O-acetylase OafA/YrhL